MDKRRGRGPRNTEWKPTVPNPALFQLPKPSKKPITIRPPPSSDESSAIQDDDLKGNSRKEKSDEKQAQKHKAVRAPQDLPADPETTASAVAQNGSTPPASNTKTKREALLDPTNHLARSNSIPIEESTTRPMTWRPDIFVQAFVPRSLLAVNNVPAKSIVSQGVEGINYSRYVSIFASPLFLPPAFQLKESPSISHDDLVSMTDLDGLNYQKYFMNCVMLELEAQTPEVRSYDLFGVQLHVIDPAQQVYNVHVPGIREEAPKVVYGDILMLRQLIVDPATSLPQGMDFWISSGSRDRGVPAPGFTGYEIIATVVAVDKRSEQLHLRAEGLTTFIPLVFNMSFVVQGRKVYCLQNTIADVANELNLSPTEASVNSRISDGAIDIESEADWLSRILFPQTSYGVLQEGLPSGTFGRLWYDENLNYEQMKAVDAIYSRSYGTLPFLIHGPPGTGKTKTVVEAATQLANDSGFRGTILLCAPSDPAADTLTQRLRAFFNPDSMLRLNEFSRTFAEVPQELMPYCYIEDNIFNLPPLPIMMSYKIVVTTCQGAEILIQARLTNRDLVSMQSNITRILRSALQRSMPLHWTALFVDEAAQATEPESLIPLAVTAPPARLRYHPDPIFVMAGDQYQLGPRTHDKATNLHVSLFERLSSRPVYASHPHARKVSLRTHSQSSHIRAPFIDLVRNYRSHPAILAVPSSLFYHNTLIPEAQNTESLSAWPGWSGRRWPVLFACNNGVEDCEDVRTTGGAGWHNSREAYKALEYAADIFKSASPPLLQSEICIMSPFRSQVNLIRKIARARGLWDLNIGPMDAFQGLESRVVVLCTTRARRRFLAEDTLRGVGIVGEPKKFNVAITRAKEGLIVFGNPWVLHQDPSWDTFLRFCWRNGLWRHDELGRDPRMPDGEEAESELWQPLQRADARDGPVGLEAALLYQEAIPGPVSRATRRFMGSSQDDEMWTSGVKAMEALEVDDRKEMQ